jgi:hypothetical protein
MVIGSGTVRPARRKDTAVFPYPTTMEADIAARQFEPRNRPLSRLEYQRRHLERKKMQSLDLTLFSMSDPTLENRLERRRLIDENIDVQVSLIDRIRNTFARVLIATGEKIRPEGDVFERPANA